MKKLITLALILCATTFIQAQNNLEFSRVLIVDLFNGSQTVPAGTVWKIEGITTNNQFKANGTKWTQGASAQNGVIWFPEGTVLEGDFPPGYPQIVSKLSIIEFSVVPIGTSGGAFVVAEHADNAAALSAGLTIGDFYRTGDFLKVVH